MTAECVGAVGGIMSPTTVLLHIVLHTIWGFATFVANTNQSPKQGIMATCERGGAAKSAADLFKV